jgi:hypothetical protein
MTRGREEIQHFGYARPLLEPQGSVPGTFEDYTCHPAFFKNYESTSLKLQESEFTADRIPLRMTLILVCHSTGN